MAVGEKVVVDVEGHHVALTNLGKVLYPAVGWTKGQVVDYYTRIAPVLLPHLAGRALTRKRYPDGVDGPVFFEKNAPRGTPEWVTTVVLPTPGPSRGRETIEYAVVDSLADAGLDGEPGRARAAHPPVAGRRRRRRTCSSSTSTPAPPRRSWSAAGSPSCCGRCWRPTGSPRTPRPAAARGCSCARRADTFASSEQASAYAKGLAQRLEASEPGLVVHRMAKALRPGKVLVDWSQNSAAKTTVAPYSLRARERPTVSTPVAWAEVEACRSPEDLVFTADDVLARVQEHGDLLAPLLGARRPQRSS